jgi:hypothetical protein
MSLSRDEKRRKKLAERQRRQARRQVQPVLRALSRDRIAAVVHEAVCAFARDDGFGHCTHYAVAGSKLVSALTGKLYLPQVGSLQIFCDGDQGLMMDASQGGVRSGEFHAWIVGPVVLGGPGKQPIPPDMEVIDFSSRHYRRHVEGQAPVKEQIALPGGFINILDTETPRLAWRLPDPPDYIWTEFRNLPKWLRVSANKEATEELLASLDAFEPLMRLVAQVWRSRQ